MDNSYELKYHKIEEEYWWFTARREAIINLIRKLDRNSKILDVGCSGGALIKQLNEEGFKQVYGVDISKKAINLCGKKGLNKVFMRDATKTGFKKNEFDIIIASDVLEHIKRGKSALNEWKRILGKGGRLLIFVPAFSFLWSEHDEINLHYKRYSKKQLIKLLKENGFEIKRASYWNFILFFPTAIIRLYQRFFRKKSQKIKKDQMYNVSPFINNFFKNMLKFENNLLKKINFPIGVSVFCIATKVQ